MKQYYYEIYTFWMNNLDKMFIHDEAYDLLLKNKYQEILLKEYDNHIFIEKDKVVLISKIILNDQISRNIHRNQKNVIQHYSKKSLYYFEENQILQNIEKFNPIERTLLLMPYSHSHELQKINITLSLVKKWLKNTSIKEEINIYEKFIKARCQKILEFHNQPILLNIEHQQYDIKEIDKKIYDKKSIDSINQIKKIDKNNEIYKNFCENMNKINIKDKKSTLSLSSGVDSNVLLFLLITYIQEYKIECNLTCLIIYYKNRLNQFEEIKIAQNLCSQLKIHLYMRTIDEIQRNTLNDRNFYEDYTKKVKYNCYEQLGEIAFLGHHKDDIFENIMNNIKKQNNYHQLNGMEVLQDYNSIQIARPMLNLTKEDILKFAHQYNIPYVYDSTPKNSERGRIRDTVLPVMKQFDIHLYEGFFKMTENFSEIYKLYERLIPKPKKIDNTYKIEEQNIYVFNYWKKIITQICYHEKINNISNKSIQHFICMIKKYNEEKQNNKQLILSFQLKVHFQNNNYHFEIY